MFHLEWKKEDPSAKSRKRMSTVNRQSTAYPREIANRSAAGRFSGGITSEAIVSKRSVSNNAPAHTPSCHGRE
eukprot:scaffold142013_cov31-Tisochrysis_lutea.AAC.2